MPRDKAMRLNGWQRTWIVLSIIWIALLASFYLALKPPEDQRYRDWVNALITYLIRQSPDLHGQTPESVRAAYSDLSDKQLVNALHDTYLPKHPAYRYGFSEIDGKYTESHDALPHKVRCLGTAFGTPLLLYVLGFAVSWVRAGFKNA